MSWTLRSPTITLSLSLQRANPEEVLNTVQNKRYQQAKTATKPTFVVTPKEAKQAQKKTKAKGTKTWRFAAQNACDFGFGDQGRVLSGMHGVVKLMEKQSWRCPIIQMKQNPLVDVFNTCSRTCA